MTRRAERWIAVVLYPGVALLDVAVPLEVLLHAGGRVRPLLVAAGTMPITTEGPVALTPSHTFRNAPKPTGLIVPGGGLGTVRAMADDALQAFLSASSCAAEAVLTIGTGALPLAATGRLDGRHIATHWGYRPLLARLGVEPVHEPVAEDGRFLSAASSADASEPTVRLVARLAGRAAGEAARAGLTAAPPRDSDPVNADASASGPGGDAPGRVSVSLPHLSPREAIARRAAMRLILAARPDLVERLAL